MVQIIIIFGHSTFGHRSGKNCVVLRLDNVTLRENQTHDPVERRVKKMAESLKR